MKKTDIAFTAPHHAATKTGQKILEQGGTAIEAMVAAAATIAVVYPHMNGLGGDGFWLISEPNKKPIAINAAGKAAKAANLDFYQGHDAIPARGGKATVTMAGAVAGWDKALSISQTWQPSCSLQELFTSAIEQAKHGIQVTQSLANASEKTYAELKDQQGFSCFLPMGVPLKAGDTLALPKLGETLSLLANQGLDSFYRGELASRLATDLAAAGSPLGLDDFAVYQVELVEPIQVTTRMGTLYNLPAPTQGIASLLILALYDELQATIGPTSEADQIHLLIEATKQAFIVRNRHVTDPARFSLAEQDQHQHLANFLSPPELTKMRTAISPTHAQAWPHEAKQGDTIWMGACDQQGRMVSYIQSLYWEFGSGVVSPSTGIVWNNRGTAFSLEAGHPQELQPELQPFHTLNPAFAELQDGRRMSYGTMGGEGQPQTQAALFSRYVYQQHSLSDAIRSGRWLLGRTWGEESHNLKMEADLAAEIGTDLLARGHDLVAVHANNELMGHAGAVVCHTDGSTSAATDPRSDGQAVASRDE
ncbi:gamma-glutamyltransferase [Marinomonas agarivorans]|nr:gamma-glutamyltransferase [Marinomonas agarivorans]